MEQFEMKHWIEGNSKNGFGEKGILLKEGDGRILSVVKKDNGFQFMEECDGYFCHTYTKDEALKLIDELMYFINCS